MTVPPDPLLSVHYQAPDMATCAGCHDAYPESRLVEANGRLRCWRCLTVDRLVHLPGIPVQSRCTCGWGEGAPSRCLACDP